MKVRITTTIFLLNVILLTTSAQNLEPFQLSEYLNGSFVDSGWNGNWVSDSSFIIKESGNFYKVDAADGQKHLFLDEKIFADYPSSSITLSNDLKFALIKYNVKPVFRRSDTAQYAIYHISEKQFHHVHNRETLQRVVLDPQGESFAYVYLNNIYYVEKLGDITTPRQITTAGVPGIVYNGVPDWVYEEEVLSTGSALWFSPNGKGLAFVHFDDTKVNDFHYFIYENSTVLYPSVVTIKYPKPGMTNPTIAVKYVDLKNRKSEVKNISRIIPVDIVSKDHILQDIQWATDTDIVAVSLNRVQNIAALVRCTVTTNKCNTLYSTTLAHGWIILRAPMYNSDGSKFLLLLSEPEENDSYKHLSLVENDDISERKRLTFGKRVVSSIYGWDEARNLVYYSGTIEGGHGQQHVYVVDLKTGIDRCLTCDVATPEGPCEFASGSFSAKFSYYAETCAGPGPKIVQVKSLTSSASFVWKNNEDLRKRLSKKYRPIIKRLQVLLSNGNTVFVRLRLPPTLDEHGNKKYPMVVRVYGGPNSNEISNAYSAGEENYFVTNREYIYASIDARGTGKNGDKLMFEVYRRLGTVEMDDQIEVTKYLQRHYKYIDASRTGIWGWSYGGFATLSILAKDTENVFKWGLAVAPVTSFRLYDTVYTERYMGLPTKEDNEYGYNNTDLTRSVEAYRNKLLFIIHGNADDNVHYQQSMILARALEKADVMFFQQSYPDEDHSIGSVRPHLYHTIDRFFDRGFRRGINGNVRPNLRKKRTRF